ncbi:MAG: universal stress protein [Chloroflexi bacterium]|nr:universal stress protein [Chloroflexota bacterium]
MYRRILVPVDNSPYSDFSVRLAVDLGRKLGAHLVGCHVYAARLHDDRFRQMETGLPGRYQEKDELRRQRQVHDSLITKGLQLISDSYLDPFEARCRQAGVPCQRRVVEGTNYVELAKEVENSGCDLVTMGIRGLGAVEESVIGSVCERVVRRIRCAVLVAKNDSPLGGNIVAAVDGSSRSLSGLRAAIALGKVFGASVEVVAVFDPYFHGMAFRSLAGVLSEEAGKVFRFREQERLHDEIIHDGLRKLYESHLETAVTFARSQGLVVTSALLPGKPFQKVLHYIRERRASLLVVGRFGAHCTGTTDIGSTAENLLRLAPCHVLIANGDEQPAVADLLVKEASPIPWTGEAEAKLQHVPPFARGMARNAIDDYARRHGHAEVTPEVMDKARGEMGM